MIIRTSSTSELVLNGMFREVSNIWAGCDVVGG